MLKVADCEEYVYGYVMSNQIVSAAIAQVSEDRRINLVLGELLSACGTELYVRDISRYVEVGEGTTKASRTMSFWDVALRARQHEEVALGYKPTNLAYANGGGRILNPPDKSMPREWNIGDVIFVFTIHQKIQS